MEAFKYSLDRSSKKYACPNCHKKTFVKYVDNETGNFLPDDFGRCDRESKCNYHKAPPKGKKCYLINFLSIGSVSEKAMKMTDTNGIIHIVPKSQIMERSNNDCWLPEWILKNKNINYLGCESKYFNSDKVAFINPVISEPQVVPTPGYHSLELLEDMFINSIDDHFSRFLKSIFTADEVFRAMQKYFITGTNHFWNNATVFWQIDQYEKVRSGKIMLYGRNGKRIKTPYNHVNWVHVAKKEADFNLDQCLYGLHLLNMDNEKTTVAIVESEKTAIIMSIFLPDFIWMATGSKGNFKLELLKALKQKNIVAFPDKGEFKDWKKKALEMQKAGLRIAVSQLLEKTDYEDGFDLADYYMKMHEMQEMHPEKQKNILHKN